MSDPLDFYDEWKKMTEEPKKRVIQEVMHDYAPDYELNEVSDLYDNDKNVKKPL